jgi:SAM-dependent methyltransferase
MVRFLWNLYGRCYDSIAGLAPYQDMLDEVVRALELAPGLRVLDAGCGTGALAERVAAQYPGVELVGIDLSPVMLKHARERRPWPGGFSFVEGNIDEYLENDLGGFDRIASVNLIWALQDPQRTFVGMTRALRPAGRMVHTTPRLRFGALRIAWNHIRRQKGRARVHAILGLPFLGLAGLLNLVLVALAMASGSARHRRQRWDAKGLESLLHGAGANVALSRPCYAGQGHLLVCAKDKDSTGLPGQAKGL